MGSNNEIYNNLILNINLQLDEKLSAIPFLVDFETKTKIPKTHIVLGGAGSIVLIGLLNVWGRLLSSIIGFAYPAYRSFQAVETDDKADDTQWLIYWTVYGFFSLVEFFSDTLLEWLPLYYLIKVAILLYLYLPQTNGALKIYNKIRPVLLNWGTTTSVPKADKAN